MRESTERVRDFIAGLSEPSGSREVLLLLHRSEDTFWSAEAAAQRLRLRAETAAAILSWSRRS